MRIGIAEDSALFRDGLTMQLGRLGVQVAITAGTGDELLANVAKHSGARHATLEAVHVPGLLRIRVTDDGRGGASAVPGGGLRGLAERIRTVDGSIEIDSPSGGPTVATVELPSHA